MQYEEEYPDTVVINETKMRINSNIIRALNMYTE